MHFSCAHFGWTYMRWVLTFSTIYNEPFSMDKVRMANEWERKRNERKTGENKWHIVLAVDRHGSIEMVRRKVYSHAINYNTIVIACTRSVLHSKETPIKRKNAWKSHGQIVVVDGPDYWNWMSDAAAAAAVACEKTKTKTNEEEKNARVFTSLFSWKVPLDSVLRAIRISGGSNRKSPVILSLYVFFVSLRHRNRIHIHLLLAIELP